MRAPEHFILGDGDNLAEDADSPEYQRRFEQAVADRYEALVREPSIARALELLDNLPGHLVYHVKAHTEDVIRETIRFALKDNAPDAVVRQQAIAAAWHDTGFLREQSGRVSTHFAEESAAIDLFRADEEFKTAPHREAWETVGNIWDTRVIPKDGSFRLDMRHSTYGYMLDADVSNFGRDDFKEKVELVAEENDIDLTDPEKKRKFYLQTLSLLRNHSWRTDSARKLRDAKKRENVAWIEGEIARMGG